MEIYCEKVKIILNKVCICKSHGYEHMIAVMQNAIDAVKELDESDDIKDAICLAALLHDIDDLKFFDSDNYQNARQILDGHPLTELIIEMIDLVSSFKNKDYIIEPEWKMIPRYCDRLEAIGQIGLERVLEFNKTMARHKHIETTIRVYNHEELNAVVTEDRYQSYNGKSNSMIDHFYDKLLQIKFPIHNAYIQKIASERKYVMEEYVITYWNCVRAMEMS
jgi:uncharacterized protein